MTLANLLDFLEVTVKALLRHFVTLFTSFKKMIRSSDLISIENVNRVRISVEFKSIKLQYQTT